MYTTKLYQLKLGTVVYTLYRLVVFVHLLMYLQHKHTVLQQQQCSTYHYHKSSQNHNITLTPTSTFSTTQIRLDHRSIEPSSESVGDWNDVTRRRHEPERDNRLKVFFYRQN